MGSGLEEVKAVGRDGGIESSDTGRMRKGEVSKVSLMVNDM